LSVGYFKSVAALKEGGIMFEGLSKKDIFEAVENAIELSVFFSIIYLFIYLMK